MDSCVGEEDLLGFHVFVAELELLVGNGRGDKAADAVALLELLQKLVVSIDHTQVAVLKKHQRRCEEVLVRLLQKGSCSEVRNAICICLSKLYRQGDSLPLYSQVNSLQGSLSAKEGFSRRLTETQRTGLLELLLHLCNDHGSLLVSSLAPTLAIATKHANKYTTQLPIRLAALRLAATAVEALGPDVRTALSVQGDALKLVDRHTKAGQPDPVRIAAIGILKAVAVAGGSALWAQGGYPFEEATRMCVAGLEDSVQGVRDAWGAVLGELAAAVKSPTAKEALQKESKISRKQTLEKVLSQGEQLCLTRPFVAVTVFGPKEACSAIARAWISYIDALVRKGGLEESDLVELSIRVVTMLSTVASTHLDAKRRGQLNVQAELGHGLSTGELPVPQACVLYILRVGVFRRLSETGHRQLADRLGVLLASVVGKHVPVGVVGLEGLRTLLQILGEVPLEASQSFQHVLLEKLVSSSAAVRIQAAAAIGALVRADPCCAAPVFKTVLEGLRMEIEQLASLAAPFGAQHPLPWSLIPGSPGSPGGSPSCSFKSKPNNLKTTMYSVYGQALGVCAVLVASQLTPLGVPSTLYIQSYDLVKKMIYSPSANVANAQAVERKAGYCILGALCVSMPEDLIKTRLDELLSLWEPALGAGGKAALDVTRYDHKELDLAMQLWWRGAALEALQAYLSGVILKGLAPNPSAKSQAIVSLVTPILAAVTSNPVLQDPMRAAEGCGGWVAGTASILQLRLLEVYLLLPGGLAFAQEHEALFKLCSRPLRGASTLASASVSASLSSTCLQAILQPQDKVLGPWETAADPLRELLNTMSGDKGGPTMHPWETGLGVLGVAELGDRSGGVRADMATTVFPQEQSLGVALAEVQLKLLGKFLSSVGNQNKVQVLERLLAFAKRAQGTRDPLRQSVQMSCICFTALAGLQPLNKDGQSKLSQSDEVAVKVQQLGQAVLDASTTSTTSASSCALKRAASQLFGCAVLFGSDVFAVRCVKHTCQQAVSTQSVDTRETLAVALGCMHRLKGGMALGSVLPVTVETLFSLVSRPVGGVQVWGLHGLWLTATAAGLNYMPFVERTLSMLQGLMTSNLDIDKLRPFVARVSNAMVAALGPELTPDGRYFAQCKSLMREMEMAAREQAYSKEADTAAAQLELVLYAQQLIMFAPQAVPPGKHIPLLLGALSSPFPSLRHAAALTLRHLAERNCDSMGQHPIESALFAALDDEKEADIAVAIQSTLLALQNAQCPQQPSSWLRVCSAIVLSEDPRARGSVYQGDHDSGVLADDAEEEAALEQRRTSGTSATSRGAVLGDPAGQAIIRTPRLKTRLFACQCLLNIFNAVGSDVRHFDLIAAQVSKDGGQQDWLVLSLQEIIKLGFSMSTGDAETLRPQGIRLLERVLKHYANAMDPLGEGCKLLFQYQAQFVSALRLALTPEAAPLLFMLGAALAVSFLKSGLGGGEATVLKQLMGQLTKPIRKWSQLDYLNYSEQVGAQARMAVLEAHAHCTCLAASDADLVCRDIVTSMQGPLRDQLRDLWLGLLTDYAAVPGLQANQWSVYKPRVIAGALCGPSNGSTSIDSFPLDWSVVLDALTMKLPAASELVGDPHSEQDEEDGAAEQTGPQQLSTEVTGAVEMQVTAECEAGRTLDDPEGGAKQGDGGELNKSTLEKDEASVPPSLPPDSTNSDASSIQVVDGALQNGPVQGSGLQGNGKPASLRSIKTLAIESAASDTCLQQLTSAEVYWRTLDIAHVQLGACAVKILEQAREEETVNVVNTAPLMVCVKALQRLLGGDYLRLGVCPADVVVEVLEILTSALLQVVHPLLCIAAQAESPAERSLMTVVSGMMEVAHIIASDALPATAGSPGFVPAFMDCVLCCTKVLHPVEVSVGISSGIAVRHGTGHTEDPCIRTGLTAGLTASSVVLSTAPWGAVVGWLGVLLRMGNDLLDVIPDNAQRFVVQACTTALLRDSEQNEQEDNGKEMSPVELVLWEGISLSDRLQELLRQTEANQNRVACTASALLGVLSLLSDGKPISSPATSPAVRQLQSDVLSVLQSCLGADQPAHLHKATVESLRALCQEVNGRRKGDAGAVEWARTCVTELGPSIAGRVHDRLTKHGQSLDEQDVQVVAESLKLLLLSTSLFEGKGTDAQAAIIAVLLPLLVEAVDPFGTPNAALAEMALKLINIMNAAALAGPFRVVVSSLPLALKQRLQKALRAAMSPTESKPSNPTAGLPTMAKPSIVLRTKFAMPSS
eukprot:evm.model.scf_1340.1 EVM.evm.TU.scf_1340.1   scf_1340:1414-16767(-)